MATDHHKHVHLPIYRIKTIMKSSPQVENVSYETIHLVARATELFVQYLARESFLCSKSNKELQYRDIALLVDRDGRFEFLRGVCCRKALVNSLFKTSDLHSELIPQKITVKEYKDLLKKESERSQLSGL